MQSVGHRLLPAGAFETPMLKAAFEQIGVRKSEDDDNAFIMPAAYMSDFFHVEKAAGSNYIVAQDEFVKPYGIQSVVGIGSSFASRAFYLMLAFATKPIDADNAKKFAVLSPHVSTLLASYANRDTFWQTPTTA
ncbi:MAG: hypothetical protein AAFR67_09060 [Chloroflexota bacterium]